MSGQFPHLRGMYRECAENYFDTMKKLNSNDKVIISSLSEIANENKQNAKIIVDVIEKRIGMVNSDCLLAHLYLIDSICKNHGAPFTQLFEPNLINNFLYVFKRVNEKVRMAMYKLRHTWTSAPLFSSKLRELDLAVVAVDPAWPISNTASSAPAATEVRGSKILINPAKFQQGNARTIQQQREEEETERMRKELLRKEKELLELKKKDIDMQLMGLKKAHENKQAEMVSGRADAGLGPAGQQQQQQQQAKASSAKKDVPTASLESRAESRDPRRRRKQENEAAKNSSSSVAASTATTNSTSSSSAKASGKSSSGSGVSSSSKHSDNSSGRSKSSSKSPSKKSSSKSDSRSSSSQDKAEKNSSSSSNGDRSSSDKKSSSQDRDRSSRERSSSRNGSSSRSAKDKSKKKPSPKKNEPLVHLGKRQEEQTVPEAKSEAAESKLSKGNELHQPSPQFSRDPSPVPAAAAPAAGDNERTSSAASKRIPKIPRKSADDERRPEKRQAESDKITPPPEKRPKPLLIEVENAMVTEESQSSPSVGWAKHKEINPDQFRTPVKENELFFPDQKRGGGAGPMGGPWMEERGGRGGWGPRGPRGGPRGFRGRGRNDWGRRNDEPRFHDQGGHQGGPPRGGFGGEVAPFGRGGARHPPRGGGAGRPPPLMAGVFDGPGEGGAPNLLAGLPGPDLLRADPEIVRKEVIPKMLMLANECREKGTINEVQYREFMNQVMHLKESSLNREAENRHNRDHANHENKENRIGGGRGRRTIFPGQVGGRRSPNSGGGEQFNGGDQNIPVIDIDDGGPQGPPPLEPSPHKNDLPLANQRDLQEIKDDPTKMLNIDEVPRDIRYYGETATIVMDDSSVLELNFKKEKDKRMIVVDGRIKVWVNLVADSYTEFMLNDRRHSIKIGKPTREIWIDGSWHECFFASKIRVNLKGKFHSIFLPGPPPSVDIGKPRPDLCRGKVYAIRDGDWENKTTLYLDYKPQLLVISHKPHVLRFLEGFKTATINGHPFRIDFGGFPMVISVRGKKHYVRLTSLPPGAKDIANSKPPLSPRSKSGQSPPRSPPAEDQIGLHSQDPLNQLMSVLPGPTKHKHKTGTNYNTQDGPAKVSQQNQNPDDHKPPKAAVEVAAPAPETTAGKAAAAVDSADKPEPAAAPATDINDLWAKLQSSGVLSLFGSSSGGSDNNGGIPGLSSISPPVVEPAAATDTPMDVDPSQATMVAPTAPAAASTPLSNNNNNNARKSLRRNSFVGIREITLKSHHPTLKERQPAIIDSLFGPSDLQCKSCGHRFGKEEMGSYSSHLDWHFRARRRERDNARKAQSRRWYYEKNDWIVSDEIEDEEQDMTEEEIILEQSMEIPTVAVKVGHGDNEQESCPVCFELFSQVFKQGEGNEEGCWMLHNAMRDPQGVAYHPECFKDKEAQENLSLQAVQTKVEEMEVDEIKEEKEESKDVKPLIDTDVEMVEDVPMTKTEQDNAIKTEADAIKTEEEVKTEPTVLETGLSADTGEKADELKTEEGTNVGVKKEKEEQAAENELSAEVKTENPAAEAEGEVKTEDADATLNLDAPENAVQAPVVVPKPKIDIKVSITSAAEKVAEPETPSPTKPDPDSEFDPEAIVVPKLAAEELAARKPRLAGRNLTAYPPSLKDGDMSGLCSIM